MRAEDMDELGERLKLAEEILGDLSSGWWQAAIGRSDTGAMKSSSMGERVQAYWRRFEAVPFVPTPCPDCKAKQSTIDRLRMNLAMMLGGDDAETLDRVEIQLSMGDLIYPPAHAGLSAIEALRETKP